VIKGVFKGQSVDLLEEVVDGNVHFERQVVRRECNYQASRLTNVEEAGSFEHGDVFAELIGCEPLWVEAVVVAFCERVVPFQSMHFVTVALESTVYRIVFSEGHPLRFCFTVFQIAGNELCFGNALVRKEGFLTLETIRQVLALSTGHTLASVLDKAHFADEDSLGHDGFEVKLVALVEVAA
jgi:hypothetical protein